MWRALVCCGNTDVVDEQVFRKYIACPCRVEALTHLCLAECIDHRLRRARQQRVHALTHGVPHLLNFWSTKPRVVHVHHICVQVTIWVSHLDQWPAAFRRLMDIATTRMDSQHFHALPALGVEEQAA